MDALKSKTILIVMIFLIPGILFSQSKSGILLSADTGKGIGYVNVGVINRNTGTVSAANGKFTINLDNVNENDSLRFSMIGFESKTLLVRKFKEDTTSIFYLYPTCYDFPEVNIYYRKPRYVRLGNQVETDQLRSGFSSNELGSELGIRVNAKKRGILKDIKFDVAVCTYDSVTYRLNIYLIEDDIICENILTKPIYISFKRNDISNVLNFDLSKYSIFVEGDILVSLELFKDLGEGKLLFKTDYFTGTTYHRKTSEGTWIKSPGEIGIYLKMQLLN
jgi:hypothetical protein